MTEEQKYYNYLDKLARMSSRELVEEYYEREYLLNKEACSLGEDEDFSEKYWELKWKRNLCHQSIVEKLEKLEKLNK